MRLLIKIFSLVFLILNICLYLFTLSEGQKNIGTPASTLIETIYISLEYYFLWVLTFWFIALLLMSLIITTIVYLFYKIKYPNSS